MSDNRKATKKKLKRRAGVRERTQEWQAEQRKHSRFESSAVVIEDRRDADEN